MKALVLRDGAARFEERPTPTAGAMDVVVRTTAGDPLHPVIARVDASDPFLTRGAEIDLSQRDGTGAYIRHIAETLRPVQPKSTPAA